MMQNWSIHFGWVKAHIRIEGNEMADKLVMAGAVAKLYKRSSK
jgi:ribonuclease HI